MSWTTPLDILRARGLTPAATRMTLELRHPSPLFGCRISPDGRFVFASGQDSQIQRWELANSRKTSLTGHQSWIRGIAFHPTERVMLSGDYAGQVLTWNYDAEQPTPIRTIAAHRGWVRAVAMAPDGRSFATCGNDNLVKTWSFPSCEPIRSFQGHESHVYNVAFHPTAPALVSGDLRGNLFQWDLGSGSRTRTFDASALFRYDPTFRADHGGIRGMTFSPDGATLAVCGITNVTNAFAGVGNPAVMLFNWQSGQRARILRPAAAFQGTGWGVAFHPSGHVLAVGGGNGGALWFWRTDREPSIHLVTLPNHARDLSLHAPSNRVAIPFFDGAVRVYQLT